MIDKKKQLRPTIPSIVIQENASDEEKFQNNILRPIIKLQHHLLLRYFEHYMKQNKVHLEELNPVQKEAKIRQFFKTDHKFKLEIRALIIGLLTLDEFEEYLKLSPNLNKRINNMIEERINSIILK